MIFRKCFSGNSQDGCGTNAVENQDFDERGGISGNDLGRGIMFPTVTQVWMIAKDFILFTNSPLFKYYI